MVPKCPRPPMRLPVVGVFPWRGMQVAAQVPFRPFLSLLLLRGEAQGKCRPVLGSGRGVRAAACQAFSKRPPVGPELGGGWHGRPLRPRRSDHRPLPAFAREPGQPRAAALPALGTGFLSPQPRWPLRSLPPLLSRWDTGMHCLSPWRAAGASDVG